VSFDWIQTYSGKAFRFDESMVETINIFDIAHHLAMKCRFGGACETFYSVAEHCVRMSQEVNNNDELAKWCLLHDAAEAYLPDVPRPLKKRVLVGKEPFSAVEGKILKIIADKYKLRFDLPPGEVTDHLDLKMLATEKRDLMAEEPEEWAPMPEPYNWRIIPWPWYHAKRHFLNRYGELFNGNDTI